ncbi:GntR family transcriptional regulator [Nonomuraea sp. NPDC050451]|uniref:GntR family transcriptional regulator n=1 Tax=Nonomuraea sp. NPDC050451 TaxID=3364364 RepID=UPI00378BF97E
MTELRRRIKQGELKPGAKLLQDALADQLGVSRVPVREALKVLEGEGQVTYIPRRGYFVSELDLEDLEEIQLLRDLLETKAIERAMSRLTDEDIAAMSAALDDMGAAGNDVVELSAAHRRFHFALLDASGLPRLTKLIHQLWDSSETYRTVYHGNETFRAAASSDHHGLLDAVRGRDVAKLVTLVREHRQHTIEGLRRTVDSAE